jgi:hypothetical protein
VHCGLSGALGLAALSFLLLAPAAFAAPPANDKFEDAKELTESLPIEVSATNVEATKEEGEPFLSFGAGHTVWYEWTAADTGFVTIDTCEREIETILGVFTGEAVNALTKVVDGNASEGPNCPFGQREYTFKAITGTAYKIAVDGSAFSFPGGPKPATEGEFELRIAATPPPVNDDFADATSLVLGSGEEFEGEVFYLGSEFGYNWNATLESGEPNPLGGPQGASVWYSWTAPASGEARVSTCCGMAPRLSMYEGNDLESLELRFGGIGPGGFANFGAVAGTTYWLTVWGVPDESSGEVQVGSFSVQVSLRAPAPASSVGGKQDALSSPAGDTTPPDTKIRRQVLKRRLPGWSFRFESTEAPSTFECKLDKRPFAKCGSSKSFMHPKAGRHALKVRAIDRSGNVDPWPAVAHFTVPGKARTR